MSDKIIMKFATTGSNLNAKVYEYPVELIGGRNLLLNSKELVCVSNGGANHYGWSIDIVNGGLENNGLKEGDAVTLSYKLDIIGDVDYSKNPQLNIRSNYGNTSSWVNFTPQKALSEEDEDSFHVFHLTLSTQSVQLLNFRPRLRNITEGVQLVFSNIKIEKGNVATPWTPAPEDLGLSYPDWVTGFKPSISENGILAPELIEYPAELVGGRNLLLNSDFKNGTNGWEVASIYKEAITNINYALTYSERLSYRLDGQMRLPTGDYMLSFDAKKNNPSDSNPTVRVYIYSSIGGTVNFYSGEVTDVWKRLSVPIRLIEERFDARYGFYLLTPNKTTQIQLTNIKLEKGTKATDWTPAPEDLGYSYPPEITKFTPSFSPERIILPEITESSSGLPAFSLSSSSPSNITEQDAL